MKSIKVLGLGLLALVGVSVHAQQARAGIVSLTDDFETDTATSWPWTRSTGVDGRAGITTGFGHNAPHSGFISLPRAGNTNSISIGKTFVTNTSHIVRNCAVAVWFFVQPDAHGVLTIGDPFNKLATASVSLDSLAHNSWVRLGVAYPGQFLTNWVSVVVTMTNTGLNQGIWFDDLAGNCEY
jgi:hypothetical protein